MTHALIWGASGGIGSALVRALKARGWRVFAAARTPARIPAEADACLSFDAASEFSIQQAVMQVASECTVVDLMVYAAGGLHAAPLDALDIQAWDSVIASNLTGAYLSAKHGLPLLAEQGHMMFIGAYVEHLILPKFGAYAAAKAGLEPLVAVLQKENRRRRFTLVHPGAVDTDFWRHAPFKLPKNAKTPLTVAEAMLAHHESSASGTLNL